MNPITWTYGNSIPETSVGQYPISTWSYGSNILFHNFYITGNFFMMFY
jgi:hypothetical protein